MEIKKFGSLIIRSKPVLPGRMYYRYKDHPTITLGASTPGNEIELPDGSVIADLSRIDFVLPLEETAKED